MAGRTSKKTDFWGTFDAYIKRTEEAPLKKNKGPMKKTIDDKRQHLAHSLREKASAFEAGKPHMGYTQANREIKHDYTEVAGVTYFTVRYGVYTLRTEDGKDMVLCFGSDRKAAVSTVRELADHVEAGELDTNIEAATAKMGRTKGSKNKPREAHTETVNPSPSPSLPSEEENTEDDFLEDVPLHNPESVQL